VTPKVAKRVSGESLKTFNLVKDLVAALPEDLDLGRDDQDKPVILSSHILARAIRKAVLKSCFISLPCIDGKYSVGFRISWLLTPDHQWVIDVCPPGVASGPILVDNRRQGGSLGRIHYLADRKLAKTLDVNSIPFRRAVRRVTVELIKIIAAKMAPLKESDI
jgi:hypothetical protein